MSERTEYRNKVITKLFGGNAYYGCYALAVTIFSLGIFRDSLYDVSLPLLHPPHYRNETIVRVGERHALERIDWSGRGRGRRRGWIAEIVRSGGELGDGEMLARVGVNRRLLNETRTRQLQDRE